MSAQKVRLDDGAEVIVRTRDHRQAGIELLIVDRDCNEARVYLSESECCSLAQRLWPENEVPF